MFFISKIQAGPLKISSVSEVMKESKQPASQLQKQKGDTPAATAGTYVQNHSFKIIGKRIVSMYLYPWLRGWSCMKDFSGPQLSPWGKIILTYLGPHFRGYGVGLCSEQLLSEGSSKNCLACNRLCFFLLFFPLTLSFPSSLDFNIWSLFAPICFLFSSFFLLSSFLVIKVSYQVQFCRFFFCLHDVSVIPPQCTRINLNLFSNIFELFVCFFKVLLFFKVLFNLFVVF